MLRVTLDTVTFRWKPWMLRVRNSKVYYASHDGANLRCYRWLGIQVSIEWGRPK